MTTIFHEWLLARREALFPSQARAAHEVGATEKTLRKWEQGDVPPEPRWVPHIARAFNEDEKVVLEMVYAAHLRKAAADASRDAVDPAEAADALSDVAEDVQSARRRAQEPQQ